MYFIDRSISVRRACNILLGVVCCIACSVNAFGFASSWVNNQNATSVLGQSSFTQASPGVGSGSFFQPGAARYDATGVKLFVTDCVNNRVVRFSGHQAVLTGGTGEAAFGQSDLVSSLAGVT